MKRRGIAVIAVVLALGAIGFVLLQDGTLAELGAGTGGTGAARADSAEEAERETVFAVTATPSLSGSLTDYIDVNGDVRVASEVSVYPDTAGTVTRLRVETGARVGKDQVIAEVDPSRAGQRFVPSPVKAPIAGTVTAVSAELGARVAASQPIARIAETRDLEIVTNVAEKHLANLTRGLQGVVRFEPFTGERFPARVTELAPTLDPVTRTIETTLRLSSRDARIRAGMFAEVKIATTRKEGIVKVPRQAVLTRDDATYVFVVEPLGEPPEMSEPIEGRVVLREVDLGLEVDEAVEITEGLEPDELIVYEGQTLLEGGARVRVVETVTPLAAESAL
jgi:multidrug efflux pump subunit AcrA (membrane-fusion protein)